MTRQHIWWSRVFDSSGCILIGYESLDDGGMADDRFFIQRPLAITQDQGFCAVDRHTNKTSVFNRLRDAKGWCLDQLVARSPNPLELVNGWAEVEELKATVEAMQRDARLALEHKQGYVETLRRIAGWGK